MTGSDFDPSWDTVIEFPLKPNSSERPPMAIQLAASRAELAKINAQVMRHREATAAADKEKAAAESRASVAEVPRYLAEQAPYYAIDALSSIIGRLAAALRPDAVVDSWTPGVPGQRAEIDALEAKARRIVEWITALRPQTTLLASTVQDRDATIERHTAGNLVTEERCRVLQTQEDKVTLGLASLAASHTAEVEVLRNRVLRAEWAVSDEKKRFQELSRTTIATTAHLATTAELANLKVQLLNAADELGVVKSQMSEANARADDAVKKLEDAQASSTKELALARSNAKLEQDMNLFRLGVDSRRTIIQDLRSELESTKAAMSAELRTCRTSLLDTLRVKDEAEAEVTRLREEVAAQKGDISRLRIENGTYLDALSWGAAQKAARENHQQLALLRGQLVAAGADIALRDSTISSHDAESSRLREELRKSTAACHEASLAIISHENKEKAVLAELQQARNDAQEAKNQLKIADTTIESFRNEAKTLWLAKRKLAFCMALQETLHEEAMASALEERWTSDSRRVWANVIITEAVKTSRQRTELLEGRAERAEKAAEAHRALHAVVCERLRRYEKVETDHLPKVKKRKIPL